MVLGQNKLHSEPEFIQLVWRSGYVTLGWKRLQKGREEESRWERGMKWKRTEILYCCRGKIALNCLSLIAFLAWRSLHRSGMKKLSLYTCTFGSLITGLLRQTSVLPGVITVWSDYKITLPFTPPPCPAYRWQT